MLGFRSFFHAGNAVYKSNANHIGPVSHRGFKGIKQYILSSHAGRADHVKEVMDFIEVKVRQVM